MSQMPSQTSTSLKIAIAGLGVVGGEVARQLIKHQQPLELAAGRRLELVAVSARSAATDRGFSMDRIDWHDNALELAAGDDVDVVIEMIGGSEAVAVDLTRAALKNGKHVITANKAMIAHHGTELASLAEENNCFLLFEAAVAGGIPAVKTLREGLAGNEMTRLAGILNGTCNVLNPEKPSGSKIRELKNKKADNNILNKTGATDSCNGLKPTACITTISLSDKNRFKVHKIAMKADSGTVTKSQRGAARKEKRKKSANDAPWVITTSNILSD